MPSCTTVGPHSHQIWPLLLTPDPFKRYFYPIRRGLWLAYYFHLALPVQVNPQHDLCDVLLNVVGLPTLIFLYARLGLEFGSAWCFYASLLCVSMLPAPYVSRRLFFRRRQNTDDAIVVDAWPAPPPSKVVTTTPSAAPSPPVGPGIAVIVVDNNEKHDDRRRHGGNHSARRQGALLPP